MRRARGSFIAVLVGLVLAWCSVFIGGVSYLATPVILLLLAWLIRTKRRRPITVLLLASPFALAVLVALLGYFLGRARLTTVGLPDLALYNVDPVTRYQSTSSGCVVDGTEWVVDVPHNATLLILRYLLGPMPGSYCGPYPSDAEVHAVLRSSLPASWSDLEADSVALGDRRYRLRSGLGSALASELGPEPGEQDGPSLRAAIFRERVLVLEFRDASFDLFGGEPLIALVDVRSGKIIAYFGNPPVSHWKLPDQWS